MKILMVAVENGALPGGKVGGMGDVVRDIPRALAELGHQVSVITPGYQRFSRLPGAQLTAKLTVPFRTGVETVELWRLAAEPDTPAVQGWVLEHSLFAAAGVGRIYGHDGPDRPYATDATKFALFCAAIVQGLLDLALATPEVIHLHDWHTALVAVLARFDPRCATLAKIRTVYSIHNLALQGIRPFQGDESALTSWFPQLPVARELVEDPRYPECFNPMRAAINLCDKVHTVSPTYALEIQQPAAGDTSLGGAGLELDLQRRAWEGQLEGILNGCEYPPVAPALLNFPKLLELARDHVCRWIGASDTVAAAELLALRRLDQWCADKRDQPALLVTSVGRVTDQKMRLLVEPLSSEAIYLEQLLSGLGPDGLLIMLGNGDPALERQLTRVAGRCDNFLFLRGYSDALAEQLYAGGDLFLMPSSFEPCGISQMLAMRAGQPCLVHQVGGLADTVVDGVDGFSFTGTTTQQQAQAMLQRFSEALGLRQHLKQWQQICEQAAAARFLWAETARDYVDKLYRSQTPGN